MNQGIDILRSFHRWGIPYTVQGVTIVVGAKIDMMINKDSGIEISFNTEHSGVFEELLAWKE